MANILIATNISKILPAIVRPWLGRLQVFRELSVNWLTLVLNFNFNLIQKNHLP